MSFFVGAVVAGVSKNVKGVSGGGISTITEVLVGDLVPMPCRGQYYGLMNAMWSVGSVGGPVMEALSQAARHG